MQYIRADGERIAYEETGSGEPLVFISGWAGAAAEWRPDMEHFGRERRCITLEHPGLAGQPLPSGDFGTADMAARIAKGLSALGVESAAVLGLSMGGAVAQELALQRPGLVERLILADTFAHMDLRAARAMSLCMKTLRDCGLKTGLQLIYWLIFGPGFYEKNLDDLDAQIDLFLGDPVSTEVFEYQAAACLAHDTRDRLEELDCPVLVIHGAEDDLLRPEAAVEMTESIPYSLLSIFEDGGHLCIWEQSERFRREVLDFLA